MKLKVVRKYKKASYTIGNLFIDGKFFCNTLEDADRGLDDSMDIDKVKRLKIANITAIPYGTYKVSLDITSPKYSQRQFYKDVCNGKVPRLLDVKGFEGILIHAGNKHTDTSGCLLVGHNKVKGQVIDSQNTFKELYSILLDAKKRGETITIDIVRY